MNINYGEGYKLVLAQNVQQVQRDVDEPYMQVKIANYAQKYNLPPQFVRRKINICNKLL